METQIEKKTVREKVEVFACRNGKRDKMRFAEAEREGDQFHNVPTDILLSWAKPGCSMCSGSGHIRHVLEENKRQVVVCDCARRRFAKAHRDLT